LPSSSRNVSATRSFHADVRVADLDLNAGPGLGSDSESRSISRPA